MKFLPALVLLVTTTGAFAAATATPVKPAPAPASAPAAKPAPATPGAKTPAAPVTPAPAPAAQPATPTSHSLTLDDYINELAKELKLSDANKKAIEDIYVADGSQMNSLLNNDDASSLQKAQEVAVWRDQRNAKIGLLLHDASLQQTFLTVEAKYRVALTELAADKGWVAAPPAPAPAKP